MLLPTIDLAIPRNTSQLAPVETRILSTLPIVGRVTIRFPKRAGLAAIRLIDRGFQFAPLGSGWIRADQVEVSFFAGRRLEGPPYEITIQGYNTDDTFSHTCQLRIEAE